MEWREVLGAVSAVALLVGTVGALVQVPWTRLFLGTVAVAMAGVAAVGSMLVWRRPDSLWYLVAALAFGGLGALLLWWGRAADARAEES